MPSVGMGDLHPSALLLLPDGHHAVALELKWLAVVTAAHTHGVGDDGGIGAGLDGDIAHGKIIDFGLLDLREGRVAIKAPAGADDDESAGEVALDFVPIFFFDRGPPQALELLDSGCA